MQQPSPEVHGTRYFPPVGDKAGMAYRRRRRRVTLFHCNGETSRCPTADVFGQWDGKKKTTSQCIHLVEVDVRQPLPERDIGARDGNRTHDPSLTKTVRYRCATRAGTRWAVRDSNPRRLSQLIYSQSHLTALETAQENFRSIWEDGRNPLPATRRLLRHCYVFRLIDGTIIADMMRPVKHFFSR